MGISLRHLPNLPTETDFFNLVTSRNIPEVRERLKLSTVGIAGLGGLGSNVAVHLARCGVGKLILADFDVVDPSNLNRQNYYLRHIGMKKSEAIKDVIRQINPYIEVETHDVYLDRSNIQGIFQGAEVLVEAFDTAECKSLIVDVWAEKMNSMAMVAASGMAGSGPSNGIRTRKMGKNLYLAGDLESEVTKDSGVMAPRVALTAAHQSNAVLRLLLQQVEV